MCNDGLKVHDVSPTLLYSLRTIAALTFNSPSRTLQVVWKSRLRAAFPDPNAYAAFMGRFSSATGLVTLAAMLLGKFVRH